MNHQPFEDWIFADQDTLSHSEQGELDEHLQDCGDCCQLSLAWQEVAYQLQTAPHIAPKPGFTSRWQACLEAERQRLERRQSLLLLSFSIGAITLIFGSLIALSLPVFQSPSLLVWTGVNRLIGLASLSNTIKVMFSALLETATTTIPLTIWVLLAGALSEMGVLWFVSYRLLTDPRRTTR